MRMNPLSVLGISSSTGMVAVAALGLLLSCNASGTSIDPMTWQQLAMTSDFIGTVECVTAGECVARYKVVDSWKGAATGAVFNASIPVDTWGPIPITAPGAKCLVMARATRRALQEFPSHDKDLRLSERARACEYAMPLFQGFYTLPLRPELLSRELRSEAPSLEQFKEQVTAFLAKSPQEQERLLLGGLAQKCLGRKDSDGSSVDVTALMAQLNQQTTVADTLTAIFAGAPEKSREQLLRQVLSFGLPETLRYFKENEQYGKPFIQQGRNQHYLDKAESRLSGKQEDDSRSFASMLSEAEIAKLRDAFAQGVRNQRFQSAFEILSERDPDLVAPWLMQWQNDLSDTSVAAPFVSMRPFTFGNTFCQKCPRDHVAHLRKLLDAREPYVQAAAAVYLSYADVEAGRASLVKKASLEGDPGAWAAVTLVGYNSKDHVPRALEVFKGAADMTTMAGMHHLDLQRRMTVLLSNAALSSGAPLPQVPAMAYEKPNGDAAYAYLSDWWKEYKDKVTLANPWLEKAE